MQDKTLTITLSALAFLLLSAGVAYAASDQGLMMRRANLTDEQIEVLDEARELRESGDFEGARDLIQNSGIEMPEPPKDRGFSEEIMKHREAVREAIENDDYDAFVELHEDMPMNVEISEDEFDKLVEAHALRVEGDFEGAKAIMDELGFHRGPKEGMGRGRMEASVQN